MVTARRAESRLYAMHEIERTIIIHRPVEEVFAYLWEVEHGLPLHLRPTRSPQDIQRADDRHRVHARHVREASRPRCHLRDRRHELNRRFTWKATSGPRATTTWAFQPSGPSTRMTFTRVVEANGLFGLPQSPAAATRQRAGGSRSCSAQGIAGCHAQARGPGLVVIWRQPPRASRRTDGKDSIK